MVIIEGPTPPVRLARTREGQAFRKGPAGPEDRRGGGPSKNVQGDRVFSALHAAIANFFFQIAKARCKSADQGASPAVGSKSVLHGAFVEHQDCHLINGFN